MDTVVARVSQASKQQRAAELQECMEKIQALLVEYDAAQAVTRIVTVGADGIERTRYQLNLVPRP